MSHDDGPDDAELMRRIAGGEETAFMIAYDRHVSAVFGAVIRFLRDREAAEEIVQETYLALWQRAAQFDPARGNLPAWLLTIARNRAMDRLRSEARRPVVGRRTEHAGGEAEPWDGSARTDGDPRARDGNPADEVEQSWVRAVIHSELADMPPEERRVLLLAYDGGLSQAEIAERLSWPIGTVKSRTRRALANLRSRLELVPGLGPITAEDPLRSPNLGLRG